MRRAASRSALAGSSTPTPLLCWLRGAAGLRRSLLGGGRALWLSGLCWAVMFTAFMLALTLTTVANVLVTMSIGPLLTALGARFVLGQRLAARTWAAIALAGIGIGWMPPRRTTSGCWRCWACSSSPSPA